MILLDTDHLSILADRRQSLRTGLLQRLDIAGDFPVVPVIAIEEQFRGWLAEIRRTPNVHRQIVPYLRLAKLVDFLRDWQIVDWLEPAADEFRRLRAQRVRIGTQDLKIASIALV